MTRSTVLHLSMSDRVKSILRFLLFALAILQGTLQVTRLEATSSAVKPGAFVSLKCYTDQRPIAWKLNGAKIAGSVHYFANEGHAQVLKIPKFSVEYNGTYACFPHNSSKSNSVTIYLTDPPVVRVSASNFSAYESASVVINASVLYQGGYLRISLVCKEKQAVSLTAFVYSERRISLELADVSRQMHGDWRVKLESHFLDSSGRGVFYSSAFFLEIIRKPNQPILLYALASDGTSASIAWSVPAGNSNFQYDRVRLFKARLTNSSGLFSYEFYASTHTTSIGGLIPGETVSFSITAIGYYTQSDTAVVSISTKCLGPHRPASFIQSSTGQVYLNLSGCVYPVCLDSNSPIPKDPNFFVERARLINATTDFYSVDLNWTKSLTEGKLFINSTSCPSVVSSCNSLLYLNTSDKGRGPTINSTTDPRDTASSQSASTPPITTVDTAAATAATATATTTTTDSYYTTAVTSEASSLLPTRMTDQVLETRTSLAVVVSFLSGSVGLALIVLIIAIVFTFKRRRRWRLPEPSNLESQREADQGEEETTLTTEVSISIPNRHTGTTSDIPSIATDATTASEASLTRASHDEETAQNARCTPSVAQGSAVISLAEADHKRIQAGVRAGLRTVIGAVQELTDAKINDWH